jgi:dipeptidyl aminopeptidase/acylaminoacyl peptidase
MEWYEIVLLIAGILAGLAVIGLLFAWICFLIVFYSPKRKPLKEDKFDFPPGKVYEPYYGEMLAWMKDLRTRPHEDVSITSFDGLTLRGKYYEYAPDAPVELLFHGYQGHAERDLSAAVERCAALGRSALLINQRGSGDSDGNLITFGILERKDCLSWIDFAVQKFGKERKLFIGGVSMGAATVMMAAGEELPDSVVCVMADCGFSSPKEIIKKVVREMHLPAGIVYPFIRLGAKLFGRFDLEETSPIEAIKRAKKPLILLHGDEDDFVPCAMSEEIFAVCPTKKKLALIKGAGHGLAYPKDKDGYVAALRDFQEECGF